LGRLYVPSADELVDEATGEWISKPKPPRIPINEIQAMMVEQAILRMPRRPYDRPRLVVYHYLTPGHKFKQTCRRLGVKSYAYEEAVLETLSVLRRELSL
jgi:hypothetical protein